MSLSTGGALAVCILRWLYAQVAPLLEALQAIILAMIAWVDAFLAALKAWLAQFDILSQIEEAAWAVVQAIVDQIRTALTGLPGGPLRELCPEFYSMITDPALALFDTAVSGLNIWRERYKNVLSFMDELETLFQYWTGVKNELTDLTVSIDDAIYWAMMEAASEVP